MLAVGIILTQKQTDTVHASAGLEVKREKARRHPVNTTQHLLPRTEWDY